MKKLGKVLAVVAGVVVVVALVGGNSDSDKKTTVSVVTEEPAPYVVESPTEDSEEGTELSASATEEVVETEEPTIEPTIEPTEEPEKELTLVDKKDIKITTKGLITEAFEEGLDLTVTNDSKKNVIVSIDDVSINGEMVSGSYYETIRKGKKSKESLRIYDEEYLEEAKEIEFVVEVINSDTYDDIFEETVTVTIN